MFKSESSIYLKERAAAKLGVSVKTLLRYSRKIGKRRSPIGSRTRLIFSEQELREIEKLRAG